VVTYNTIDAATIRGFAALPELTVLIAGECRWMPDAIAEISGLRHLQLVELSVEGTSTNLDDEDYTPAGLVSGFLAIDGLRSMLIHDADHSELLGVADHANLREVRVDGHISDELAAALAKAPRLRTVHTANPFLSKEAAQTLGSLRQDTFFDSARSRRDAYAYAEDVLAEIPD